MKRLIAAAFGAFAFGTVPAFAEHLLVRTLVGQAFDIDIALDKSVLDLKTALSAKIGVPPDQMRFIYATKDLDNAAVLKDLGIQDGSQVYVVFRKSGS